MKQKRSSEIVQMIEEGRLQLAFEHTALLCDGSASVLCQSTQDLAIRHGLLQREIIAGRITQRKAIEETARIGSQLKILIEQWPRLRRVLFLGANPVFKDTLALDKEVEKMEGALRACRYRDSFLLERATALRPLDFASALLHHEPDIVHFSGHGTENGLVLLDDHGMEVEVPTNRFGPIFELFDGIQCLVLNACHSIAVALYVREYLPASVPIIAMSDEVLDTNAIAFSKSFYEALGEGYDYHRAFLYAKAASGLSASGDEASSLLTIQ
jgi:hypothetical protein